MVLNFLNLKLNEWHGIVVNTPGQMIDSNVGKAHYPPFAIEQL